jgi:hypothetical protein
VSVINQGLISADVSGGTISIQAQPFINQGTLNAPIGTLSLSGTYNLAGGSINIGISGLSNFGHINFAGTVSLAGTLSATLTNGFVPAGGSSFTILTYGSNTGVFGSLNLPADGLAWQLNYGTTAATLTVLAQPLIQAAMLSGTSFKFTWNTTPSDSYQIQSTANLNPTAWAALGGTITASNFTTTVSEPVGTNSQQFYRVVLLP